MGAYRLRSRLVHGHDAKPINVAGVLRLALKQAIGEAAAGVERFGRGLGSPSIPPAAGECVR
jgi:hypothetical protein